MSSPAAEVDIDAALIERLMGDQFPHLAGPVRIVANGWDNVIARVGARHCVRLPRRSQSVALVQHEIDWLPRIARSVPIDVPAALAVGTPGAGYPWPWLVCPWFEGGPLADLAIADRVGIATQLGAVVAALHGPAPESAPTNAWRGISLAHLEPRVWERLRQLPAGAADRLAPVWERCRDAPPHPGPPTWVHGDLHPLNVLVTPEAPALSALSAVIDWGDVCRGDPATDLAVGWLAFDETGRTAFRAAAASRHPLDDPVWVRARGWALALAMLFELNSEPGSALRAIGAHGLAQLESAAKASG